ncbi:MAG: hypothetical protein ACU84J_10625 [Gammaproteobacteria bacterium]
MSLRYLLTAALLCTSLQATADQVLSVKAENVTGWNRFLGQTRYHWDFLAPPLDTAGANTIGEYDPNGTEAVNLTPDAPDDTVLASYVDVSLEIVFPPFQLHMTDPATLNVPIRDTATIVSGDGVTRGVLPFIEDAAPTDRSFAAPNDPNPITLGDWLKASGNMFIRCRGDEAELHIKVRDLIPNRAYTVWAMWHLANGRILPQPFGGVPNAYITDNKGNADFQRKLNFCPMQASKDGIDGSRLLSIITHIHSDHIIYGAVPFPAGAGFPPGSVGSMQLEWNFPGTGIRLIP